MSKRAEPIWHQASEKPTGKHDYYVLLVGGEGQRNYFYFDAGYDKDEGFMIWSDQGYGNYWWSPIQEKIIGWMYQEELEKYLINLHI